MASIFAIPFIAILHCICMEFEYNREITGILQEEWLQHNCSTPVVPCVGWRNDTKFIFIIAAFEAIQLLCNRLHKSCKKIAKPKLCYCTKKPNRVKIFQVPSNLKYH